MENLILFAPLTAYLLDILLGEPNTKYHPVCWLGNTALFLEQKTLSECKTNTQKFICGIFCTCLLLLIFAVLPLLVFAVGKNIASAMPMSGIRFLHFSLQVSSSICA